MIRSGDTVVWQDVPTADVFGQAIDSGTHELTYFLRTNASGGGATAVGVAEGDGWRFVLPASVTAGFEVGVWYFQAVATAQADGAKTTLGTGQINVEASLGYTGTPDAFDGRSQLRKDLEAVQAAIRALMGGGAVQEYRIGSRNLKRYDLAELLALESRLKAQVVREDKAAMIANGLGNPHNLFVRFGR
jgi:hypothetical protein